MASTPYAELHSHTNFSFLDGASAPDDLVERAVQLGLTGLAVTDHNGLYGAVRFVSAAEAAGLHPVIGLEIELLDPVVADPAGIVVPPRRRRQRRPGRAVGVRLDGLPTDDTPLIDTAVTEGLPRDRHVAGGGAVAARPPRQGRRRPGPAARSRARRPGGVRPPPPR